MRCTCGRNAVPVLENVTVGRHAMPKSKGRKHCATSGARVVNGANGKLQFVTPNHIRVSSAGHHHSRRNGTIDNERAKARLHHAI